MKSTAPVWLIAILCSALIWSVLWMFDASFETGSFYPTFSSLRKDPTGTSVLFESLARLRPDTERSYLPLERAHWSKRTLFLLGVPPPQLARGSDLEYRVVEQFARQGNRVVLALDTSHAGAATLQFLAEAWGLMFHDGGTSDKPQVYFSAGPNWTILRDSQAGTDVIERRFGEGSLVLSASPSLFTNGSLASSPDPGLLASIIGEPNGVVFDEAHFGIEESGSVMSLLRGFHLEGLLFGFLLLSALLVWKFSSSFPPVPQSGQRQSLQGRRSFSGLIALLRRNVSTVDLATVSWQEWLKGATRPLSPERRLRVEQILGDSASQPMGALRNIHQILHRRRTD